MKKALGAFAVLLVVTSCGSKQDQKAPRNLDNACSILEQRPHFGRAFRAAERNWGVKPNVMMAMIYQESKFIGDARTPLRYAAEVLPIGRQSSAYGYSQALDGTWKEYQRMTGNRSAKRDNIGDATDFMGWYMNRTREINGVSLNDARNQYLAYHDGHTGFRKGTYWGKPWLVRISGEIEQRADLYETQLASCSRRLR